GRVGDADPEVRARAATALGDLAGRTVDSWWSHDAEKAWNELVTLCLHDQDDDVGEEAVKALTTLCQSPDRADEAKRLERKRHAVQSLLDGFKSGNVEVRRRTPEAVFRVTGLKYHQRGIRRDADDAVDQEMRPGALSAL